MHRHGEIAEKIGGVVAWRVTFHLPFDTAKAFAQGQFLIRFAQGAQKFSNPFGASLSRADDLAGGGNIEAFRHRFKQGAIEVAAVPWTFFIHPALAIKGRARLVDFQTAVAHGP